VDSWHLLLEIVILLTACLVLGGIASRLGQSALIGYLLAGMLLGGPGSLQVISARANITTIAELGVALLLFSLGLEFSWQRIRNLGRFIPGSGTLQIVSTGVLAIVVAVAFGLSVSEAVAIGAMISLSSTAAVLRILSDRAELDSLHGRTSLGILLVQDIAVIPLVLLMTMLGSGSSPTGLLAELGQTLLAALALIIGLYLIVDVITVRALRSLALERHRELTMLLAIVLGLGAAWGAHAAGLSPALGAFLAGMFLGSSPFATQVRADISPLRIVLLTLFFGAVGMVADISWIIRNPLAVIGLALALIVGKTLVTTAVLLLFKRPLSVAVATGITLAQVGEFAFVLGTIGTSSGLLGAQLYMLLISAAIVTLFLTPFLVSVAPKIARRLQSLRGPQARVPVEDDSTSAHATDVIIVGFGPAGRAVARLLAESVCRVTVIDLNHESLREVELMGFSGHLGDATQTEVLEHAGAGSAGIVAVTIPTRSSALLVLQKVRAMNPHAFLAVRSRFQNHMQDFELAGADTVINEEAEVGEQLAQAIRARLASAADTGDSSVPSAGECAVP